VDQRPLRSARAGIPTRSNRAHIRRSIWSPL